MRADAIIAPHMQQGENLGIWVDVAFLPISLPLARHRMAQRRAHDHEALHPVRFAAVGLAPLHFVRIGAEIATADAMVRADLSPAQPGEIALGLIGKRRPLRQGIAQNATRGATQATTKSSAYTVIV